MKPPAAPATKRSGGGRLKAALQAPADIAGLAYFRIVFGICLVFEAQRLIGFRRQVFLDREMLFTFWPFDFIGPIPQGAVKALLFVLLFSGLLVATGCAYRLGAVGAFFSVTYIFLLDKTYYLNHIYLVCLLSFLMIFLPADRFWSIRVRQNPEQRWDHVPAWCIWLLRFQVGVPYFFAGIAKMTEDWLVRSEPLRMWLQTNLDFPLIGRFFDDEPVIRFMSLGSMVLDFSMAFLLLNRRTRVPAYAAALLFHLMNARLFNIGIFPWMMIAVTPIFFPPEWPRKMLDDLRSRTDLRRVAATVAGAVVVGTVASLLPRRYSTFHLLIGALGGAVLAYMAWTTLHPDPSEPENEPSSFTLGRWTFAALAVWVGLQVLVPLRHYVIPGDVNWTEEGHRFSWHMLARDKQGGAVFFVRDLGSGERWRVEPTEFLTQTQAEAMTIRPDMILEFAHYLRDRGNRVGRDVEVKVEAMVSLNGAPETLIVDPDVDLAKIPRVWLGHAGWIVLSPGEPQ